MKLPFTFTLQPRLFALLAIGFVITTIVGTVSHELGHGAVAKLFGHDVTLHYASMNYTKGEHDKLRLFVEENKAALESEGRNPAKDKYDELTEKERKESILAIWGGPLQTVLTGTIGLVLLWLNRKKIRSQAALTFRQWVCVFLAFFWSRQLFNWLTGHTAYISRSRWGAGDEVRLSKHYGLPTPTIDYIGASIALVVLVWVVFYIIPKPQRFQFIIAGLTGSTLGFALWMYSLGPMFLP